jgi:hypothetical protein
MHTGFMHFIRQDAEIAKIDFMTSRNLGDLLLRHSECRCGFLAVRNSVPV